MNTLYRYISFSLFKGWVIVFTVVISIFSLLAVVDELDRVTINYTIADALQYVAGTIPQQTIDLAPVIILLGSLLGLAGLARHSEIIAMRSAGISLGQFVRAVSIPSLLLVIGMALFSEFVAAPLQLHAEEARSVLRSGKGTLLKGQGLWLTDGRGFLNVGKLEHGAIPSDISIYDFDQQGKMTQYIHAEYAEAHKDRSWVLHEVTHRQFDGITMHIQKLDQLEMGPFWAPDELPVIHRAATSMPLVDLYHYIEYLKSKRQKTQRLELSLWQKATLPLSTVAMVLLAIPIGTKSGSQRSAEFARRLAIGAMIGISFYLITQIVHTVGLMAGLPVTLTAFIPLLLILGTTAILMKRMT